MSPLGSAVPRIPRSTGPPPEGRVALVNGGDRGIGPQIVRRLAELGMRVVLGSQSAEHGRRALDAMGDLADRVAVRQLDVLDPDCVERQVAWMHERLGRCDVLVNNTTGPVAGDRGATRADLDLVRRTIETNVVGSWRLTQAVVPMMLADGYGRVVTVCTGNLHARRRGQAAYRVSLGAVRNLTAALSDDLASRGILVNACSLRLVGRARPGRPARSVLRRGGLATPTRTPVWLATLPDDGPTGRLYIWPSTVG
jgi:NAD(P)-dependent dehydrogenase (short-subunit alcohol dehydrogenase family)